MIRRTFAACLSLALVGVLLVSSASGQGAPTVASLSEDGAYDVMTYTDFPDVPEFGDATIYYPVATPAAIGGVAIATGFTEQQRHINWWVPGSPPMATPCWCWTPTHGETNRISGGTP